MKLNVQSREITGKKVKQLRKQDIIPAVIYGKHTKEAILISCNKNEFLKLFKKAGHSTPITITGEGIDQLALIHDIQVDPVTDFLSHIDFLAVSRDEKVTAEIHVILVGESSIEKLGEGKVQLLKDTVEVEAYPQDLPHEIKIDISNIQKMSDVIFVKDLDVGSKVEILEDQEQAMVTVMMFTEETEEVPAVEGEAAGTAGVAATPATAAPTAEKKEAKKEGEKK
ncbi:MAG: 50S ribosomal protein L25 [Candidatus Absconditicoccaceae bacterium]